MASFGEWQQSVGVAPSADPPHAAPTGPGLNQHEQIRAVALDAAVRLVAGTWDYTDLTADQAPEEVLRVARKFSLWIGTGHAAESGS
ncbi:MAG TPA: hypothetical protein VIQ30_20075 [Pseudonocardia sp.]